MRLADDLVPQDTDYIGAPTLQICVSAWFLMETGAKRTNADKTVMEYGKIFFTQFSPAISMHTR